MEEKLLKFKGQSPNQSPKKIIIKRKSKKVILRFAEKECFLAKIIILQFLFRRDCKIGYIYFEVFFGG